MSRQINLDGLMVTMTMTGARVGKQTFTVGVVRLPDPGLATQAKAVGAMRAAMVRNIGGRETNSAPVLVSVLDPAGRSVAMHEAMRVEATGKAAGQAVFMSAQFGVRRDRAWQVVYVGTEPDPDNSKLFLDSFRIVE